ncbi:MAG: lipopolysaccharide biosynthesis protein [Deferrisomatales bacterium]
MSEYRKLAKHSSRYLVAQLAAMAAGVISMPILARVLTKDEYGKLSLVLLSVSFLAAFGRLGIPQSITRHFPEYRSQGPDAARRYTASLISFSALTSGAIALGAIVLGGVATITTWREWAPYIGVIGFLLCNSVMLSVISEIYRVQNRSASVAGLDVSIRYAALAGSFAFYFMISRTLMGFLTGKLVLEVLTLLLFAVPLAREGFIRPARIDGPLVREAVDYGLPLSLATAAGFFIGYGDRFVIQSLLDSAQVATYSLPYDLIQQVEVALTTPIRMAIIPMVFAMLVDKGREETVQFLSGVIKWILLLVIPMTAGISVLSRDIVVLFGSEKYADASSVVPFLAIGILFGGINFLFTVGLSYQKRTRVIALMTLGSGVFNILLNLLLIPSLGIMGSAVATLTTYAVHMAVSYRLSSRFLRVQFYPASLLRGLVAAGAMVGVLLGLRQFFPMGALAVPLKILLGAGVYGAAILVLEREVRAHAGSCLRKARALVGLAS